MESFATAIKILRGADTQEAFAAKLGVTQATVSRWEAAEMEPPALVVVGLGETLALSPRWRRRLRRSLAVAKREAS